MLASIRSVNNVYITKKSTNLTNAIQSGSEPQPNLSSLNLKYYKEISYKFKSYKNHANIIKGIKLELSTGSIEGSTGIKNTSSNSRINIILAPNECIANNPIDPIEYGEHFNDLIIKEKYCTWSSAGAAFHLTFDGKLTVISKQQIFTQKLSIKGLRKVLLAGKGFNDVQIHSNKIKFADNLIATSLNLRALIIFNDKIVIANFFDLLAKRIDNHGKMSIEVNGIVKADLFDNEAGDFFCNNQANLTSEEFRNSRGNFSGAGGTYVKIKKTFISDPDGEIGTNGNTVLEFPQDLTIEHLGVVHGKQVQVLNAPIVKNDSRIISDRIIIHAENNLNKTINMPQVIMQTPLLKLYGTDFNLGEQACCERIILKLKDKTSLQFTYPLRTSGILEIHESEVNKKNITQRMLDRFGEIKNYDATKMPEPEYTLTIQATFQADRGILVLVPSAKVSVGEEAQNNHSELLAELGDFRAYATEFDIEDGGAMAVNGLVWSPKGCRLGRLITDPSRKAYATFYASAKHNYSHNLGGDIVQRSYVFLGKEVSAYDGRHLLTMPIAMSNGSFIHIDNFAKFIGPFNNMGILTGKHGEEIGIKHLSIDSNAGQSVWEAGIVNVAGDCCLNGHFVLKRFTTNFNFFYYTHGGIFGSVCNKNSYLFCNSAPSKLNVKSILSGNATIDFEASYYDIHEQTPEIKINLKNFYSSIHQQFISNSREEFKNLNQVNISSHSNDIAHNGCLPYAREFLKNTNNFAGADKVFEAQFNPKNKDQMLNIKQDTTLEGSIACGGNMLVILNNNKLTIGSRHQYHIAPVNPIRKLEEIVLNAHLTQINTNFKLKIAESVIPKFHFRSRERFRFNELAAQEFYQDIVEHIIIRTMDLKFKKPEQNTVFSLSPNYLLASIIEQTQEVLRRSEIYIGTPMDLEFVKELHRNTTEYFKTNQLIDDDNKEEQELFALIVSGKNNSIEPPEEPIIYYEAYINDQELIEVMVPRLVLPPKMINKVRAQPGGLFQGNNLWILDGKLTIKEKLELYKNQPVVKKILTNFLESNPKAIEYLNTQAVAVKEQGKSSALEVINNNHSNAGLNNSSVNLYGNFEIKQKMGIIVDGEINVSANINTEDALLASLYGNVHVKSLIERRYNNGSMESFDDVIIQAKIHADNVLQILASSNVILEGVETSSGTQTLIVGLAGVLDIPVPLVHQRVTYIREKRKSGFTKDIYKEQHNSVHGSVDTVSIISTGQINLYSLEVNARKFQVEAAEANVLDTEELRSHEEEIEINEEYFFGLVSVEKQNNNIVTSSISKGAKFNVDELEISGIQSSTLRNVKSNAHKNIFNTPELNLLAGRNELKSYSSYSSSSLVWNKQRMQANQAITYSPCNLIGNLEINANQVTLEMVKNATSDLLERIEQSSGNAIISCIKLDPFYFQESHSKQGPGPLLIGLVALAVGIATQGICSNFAISNLSLAKGTLSHMLATQGLSSLCAQTAAQIVANNGDPIKAIKALASMNTVKSIAMNMASTLIMNNLCEGLKIKELAKRELVDHIQYHIARASVSTTLNMSIGGKETEKSLTDGLIDAAIGIALAPINVKIDSWHDLGETSMFTHTAIKAAIGAGVGVLRNDGAVAGMLEYMTTAIVEEMFPAKKEIKREIKNKDKQVTLHRKPMVGEQAAAEFLYNLTSVPNKDVYKDEHKDDYAVSSGTFNPYYEHYICDDNQLFYRNPDNSIRFGRGLFRGMAINTAIVASFSLPIVGPYISTGILFASVASAYVWANSKLSKFEQDNFIFSEDYENIMNNPLISDKQKQKISQDAHARYKQVQQNRENFSSSSTTIIDDVKEIWNNEPEELGTTIGLFFGFAKPISRVATINSNPIKPRLPFKINTVKSRIRDAIQYDFQNWNFASRLTEQLQDPRLGSLSGKINLEKILELAHNPKAYFFLDKNTGHVNVIQKVNGISDKFLRITVIKDEQKIISVGVVRETSLLQYTNNNSRYIEIGVKKISEQIKGPRVKNE